MTNHIPIEKFTIAAKITNTLGACASLTPLRCLTARPNSTKATILRGKVNINANPIAEHPLLLRQFGDIAVSKAKKVGNANKIDPTLNPIVLSLLFSATTLDPIEPATIP